LFHYPFGIFTLFLTVIATGATVGTGINYLSGVPKFAHGVRSVRYVFLLFVFWSLYWLSYSFTASEYPLGIIKLLSMLGFGCI